jgi:hypothetical protein
MEFTVFTTAGGFREFPGDSNYEVGERNGVLYVFEGATGQVIVYGPSAWASVQEWQRGEKPEAGGRRKVVVEPVTAS